MADGKVERAEHVNGVVMHKVADASFMTAAGSNQVLIGIRHDDTVYQVSVTPEVSVHCAWNLLDSACSALEKAGRAVPKEIVSAMGLLRPWVKNES